MSQPPARRRCPSLSVDDLIALLRGHLDELRQRYGVRGLGLFGSYVRGEHEPSSDLDVLVDFDRPPTLLDFVALEMELSDLLGVPVDLVMRSALKPTIGARILKEVVMA